jgi:hypothetical protein
MKLLAYFKWPLILLLVGFILQVVGATLKILHWSNTEVFFVFSTATIVISVIWLLAKMLKLDAKNQ